MKHLSIAITFLAATAFAGCGKKEDKPASAPSSESAKPAEGDKAAAGGKDDVICCEFNGAVGTSTKAKCDEFKGKVVDGLAPPCKK